MNAVERLGELITVLEKCGGVLCERVNGAGQQDDPPAIAFRRAFDFGCSTLRSAALVLRARHDYLSSITLVRGFFELAMRMFWASREPSGWQRFQVYYVGQDKTWAVEARASDGWRELADRILTIADDILGRLGPNGKPYESMPRNLGQIMQDNEDRDIREGQIDERPAGGARFQYTQVYRMMCRPAHGNVFPLMVECPKPDLRHLVIGAGLAVSALLRATCVVAADDEQTESEATTKQVLDIIAGSGELSLDDLPEPDTE